MIKSNVSSLLIDLIKIKSPSDQEIKICDFVFNLLKREGFSVNKILVDKNGYNIIAKVGRPKIFFSAHLDTVAGEIEIKETATTIFGRGACDTKGSVAAMITAGIESKNSGLSEFGLIFTVGEEHDFRGVKQIIKNKISVPFVVVGEPTSLDAVNGHFGYLEIKLIVQGKSAHSSQPEKGINAIDKLLKVLESIKNIKLGAGTFYEVCKINGGDAGNTIPDHAEATLSFRIAPSDKNDYIKQIKKAIGKIAQIEIILQLDSVQTEIPSEISFLKNIRTVLYGTELSYFKNGIVLGPGDIKLAHSNQEQIKKSELEKAVSIYTKIIENFNK